MKLFATLIVATCLLAFPAHAQNYGKVSDGNCNCKRKCAAGTSEFSKGLSKGACAKRCERASLFRLQEG